MLMSNKEIEEAVKIQQEIISNSIKILRELELKYWISNRVSSSGSKNQIKEFPLPQVLLDLNNNGIKLKDIHNTENNFHLTKETTKPL